MNHATFEQCQIFNFNLHLNTAPLTLIFMISEQNNTTHEHPRDSVIVVCKGQLMTTETIRRMEGNAVYIKDNNNQKKHQIESMKGWVRLCKRHGFQDKNTQWLCVQ